MKRPRPKCALCDARVRQGREVDHVVNNHVGRLAYARFTAICGHCGPSDRTWITGGGAAQALRDHMHSEHETLLFKS